MRQWDVVIGLETHVQLQCQSKIFSSASCQFGAAANSQASAIDLAMPGVLPVLNQHAVECAIRFGLAVHGEVANISQFARKNYFYPDLPKGYQISQFEHPVVIGGELKIFIDQQSNSYEKTVKLTRAHLEEDAGKSLHLDYQGRSGIDFNRAGTPLLEIVTEPVITSSDEAVAYAKALHALVCWIGICDGNLQEGSFRCDANVSLKAKGSNTLGTRREIKNLNSFRFLKEAIEAEIAWQIEELEDGRQISQATVLFDADSGQTKAMRSKEDAHDYRYFPDPDLLPLKIEQKWIDECQKNMPLLPDEKKSIYQNEYSLSSYDANYLISSIAISSYFDLAVAKAGKPQAKLCANWIMGEISARLNRQELSIEQSPINAAVLAEMLVLIATGQLSHNTAKKVFEILWQADNQLTITQIIEEQGLGQINDSALLEKVVAEVLAANQQNVVEFQSGKEKALNSLVGQVMKATGGKANAQQINQMLREQIAEA